MPNLKALIHSHLTDAHVERIANCKDEEHRGDVVVDILVELGKSNKELLRSRLKERLFNLLFVLKERYNRVYTLQDLQKYKFNKFNIPILRKAARKEFFRVVDDSEYFLFAVDLLKIGISKEYKAQFSEKFSDSKTRSGELKICYARLTTFPWFKKEDIDPKWLKKIGYVPGSNVYFTRRDQITWEAFVKKVDAIL